VNTASAPPLRRTLRRSVVDTATTATTPGKLRLLLVVLVVLSLA